MMIPSSASMQIIFVYFILQSLIIGSVVTQKTSAVNVRVAHPETECLGVYGKDDNTFSCIGTDSISKNYTCTDAKEDDCHKWAEQGEW
jgi:hypothetical protein